MPAARGESLTVRDGLLSRHHYIFQTISYNPLLKHGSRYIMSLL